MQIKVSKFKDIEEARQHAHKAIDEAAEATRAKYLTPGSGQALEYQRAYEQALAYREHPEGTYPMLQADVDAGIVDSLSEAADLIIHMREQWEQVGQAIRTLRLGAKHQVRLADSQREIAQIREQAVQALSDL